MRANGNGDAYNGMVIEEHQQEEDHEQSPWKQRKKVLRNFFLTNSYVPLVGIPSPRITASHVLKV